VIEDHLLRLLRKDNPWLDGAALEPWFARCLPQRYIPRRVALQPDERVCLVVGPRQAGKSTLIWNSLAQAGEPGLYLNCEEPAMREWLTSPASFLADLDGLAESIPSLFFEEVQRLTEAGLFLKGVVDRHSGKRIYATGSSAFDLQARTRESLAGRAHRHLLLPLAVDEIAGVTEGAPRIKEERLAEEVERRQLFGCYPSVYLADNPKGVLAELVEALVLRDASDRFHVRYPAAYRKILELAASQVGNLCNFSEWAATVGVSNDTVAEYVSLMEDSHVLSLIPPFVGGKRAEITRARKVYFIDNGIRNQLFGGFTSLAQRADRGALLESFVFSELAKYRNPLLDGLHFWRSKSGAEVDFVLERQGRLLACEVKAGDARGRVSRSTRSFLDAYRPELLIVVNRTAHPPRAIGPTEVRFVPPSDLWRPVDEFLSR
jgi:predicted AAA+ superfamily ATPase